MILPGRLSVCYVAPGRDFRPGTTHCREVLTLARALARDADVTVAFRRVGEDARCEPVTVMALEAGRNLSDDVAPSRRALGRFVEQHADGFGVVLEGSWPMSGKLTAWCAQRGIPAIPIIDRLPSTSWLGALDAGRAWLGLGASGRYLRRAPVIVAGSEKLREAIVERWRVERARIVVIGPAIDRTVFAPRDQDVARRRLGLAPDHRIVLAGDGVGRGPDLVPLIEAVQRVGDPALRLHVLGDGERAASLERIAGPAGPVTFHRLMSDDMLSTYIAAADLCVSVEESGDGFTIPECLSCARPVVVAAPRDRLYLHGRRRLTGFVIEHDVLAWIRFLQRECPSRNTLRMMGMAASGTPIEHVDRTAAAYRSVIDRVRVPVARPVATV
jgi:hypothetical protein